VWRSPAPAGRSAPRRWSSWLPVACSCTTACSRASLCPGHASTGAEAPAWSSSTCGRPSIPCLATSCPRCSGRSSSTCAPAGCSPAARRRSRCPGCRTRCVLTAGGRPASSSSTAGDDCCGVGSGLLFARRGAEQEMRLLGGQGRHRQRRRAPTLRTDPVEEDPQVAAVELRQVIPADYLAAAVGHLRQDGERDLQEDQVHAGQTGAATISTTVTRACSSCCAPSTESVRQENPHE